MENSIVWRVKQLISEKMRHYVGNATIDDDTVLFRGGLNLDSIAVVELLSLTEREFGVDYEEDDLREEHFRTPQALAALLERRGAN